MNLETMTAIQEETERTNSQLPLDEEGKALAEKKRFTFDVIVTPADPLR